MLKYGQTKVWKDNNMSTHHGTCACGDVSVSIAFDPLLEFQCHCSVCKLHHGTSLSALAFGEDEITIDGTLESKINYKMGQEDGAWVRYYENGQLKERGTKKDGKTDGPFISYYENGQLDYKFTLKDSKKHGHYVHGWPNGQLLEETTYKDDVQVDGPYVKYHQNGQVSAEGLIKDGKYEGLSLAYYEDGQIWIKRIHNGGSTDVTEYFPDGKISSIETWKDRKLLQRKGFYIEKCKKAM